jgi:formamidopyrimidine-DNA glycosylase
VLWFAAVPELPEVETVRRSLAPYLVGKRVVGVEARRIRLREGISPASWHRRFRGVTIVGLDRRGKYLLLYAEGAVGVFHLGMSGRLVLCRPEVSRAPHTHLVLRMDNGVEVRFVDPRRFGVALALRPEELGSHPGLARLGPDPLSAEIDAALLRAAARSRAPIRGVVLDQKVLAGLGNIYANEALARAGISPLRRARSISGKRIAALAGAIRAVLGEALEAGGTTLRDGGFVNASGDGGYFAVRLLVYGREGEPCVRCGTSIRRRTVTGRSVFYCPRCQR